MKVLDEDTCKKNISNQGLEKKNLNLYMGWLQK